MSIFHISHFHMGITCTSQHLSSVCVSSDAQLDYLFILGIVSGSGPVNLFSPSFRSQPARQRAQKRCGCHERSSGAQGVRFKRHLVLLSSSHLPQIPQTHLRAWEHEAICGKLNVGWRQEKKQQKKLASTRFLSENSLWSVLAPACPQLLHPLNTIEAQIQVTKRVFTCVQLPPVDSGRTPSPCDTSGGVWKRGPLSSLCRCCSSAPTLTLH